MAEEKTEEPTKKKLEEAAEKGQVGKSPSVSRFLASVAVLELLLATRNQWMAYTYQMVAHPFNILLAANGDYGKDLVTPILIPVLGVSVLLSLIVLIIASVFGVAGNIVQTGFMIAPKSMPKADGLNPINNVKQMFTMEKFLELLLNVAKVVVIGFCVYLTIYASIETLVHMGDGTLELAFQVFMELVAKTERSALVAILFLVFLDWAVKHKEFMKQMMMSHEDIKKEHKDTEGDPHAKQHRKKLGRELVMGQVSNKMKKADAIVTNPTHFAVALRYAPEEAPLPIVVMRGADELAYKMVEIAKQTGIPVIRYVWLARTLYATGLEDKFIPRLTLRAVATVYRAISEVLGRGDSIEETIEIEGPESLH